MRRLICLLLIALPGMLSAQNYVRKECASDLEFQRRNLYECGWGGLLSVNFPVDYELVPTVSYIDNQMNLVYNNPLPELMKHFCMGSLFNGQRLLVFGHGKDNNEVAYEINPKTGAVAGGPVVLFQVTGMTAGTLQPTIFTGHSPDSSLYYIITKSDEKHDVADFCGAVFDNSLRPLYTFSYTTDEKYPDSYTDETIMLSNSGYLDIVYYIPVIPTKKDYTPRAYFVTQINPKGRGKELQITGLTQGNFGAVAWTAVNDKLAFTGILQKNKKTGFTDILSGVCTPATGMVSDLADYPIDQLPSLKNSTQPYQKVLATAGIDPAVLLMHQYAFPDGSSEYVYEVHGASTFTSSMVTQAAGSPVGFTTYSSASYYSIGDTYVLKVDARHEPTWIVQAHKLQEESKDYIQSSIACVLDHQGGVHIFYYDNRKRPQVEPGEHFFPMDVTKSDAGDAGNAVTVLYVAADGKATKTFLFDKKDLPKDYYWMFTRCISIRQGQLIYISMDTKSSYYVAKEYDKSKYHIGTIDIN